RIWQLIYENDTTKRNPTLQNLKFGKLSAISWKVFNDVTISTLLIVISNLKIVLSPLPERVNMSVLYSARTKTWKLTDFGIALKLPASIPVVPVIPVIQLPS